MSITWSSTTITLNDGTTITTAGSQSAAANGYRKLPSGVIVQWGTAVGSTNNDTVTFPLAFPSACGSVVITYGPTTTQYSQNLDVKTKSASNFTWERYTGNGSVPIQWIAMGY